MEIKLANALYDAKQKQDADAIRTKLNTFFSRYSECAFDIAAQEAPKCFTLTDEMVNKYYTKA